MPSDSQATGDQQPTITAVDLFCGAGGFSEGLSQAAGELGFELREAAVNHWDRAVETHEANHPEAHQYQSKVEQLHTPEVVQRLTGTDDPMPDVDLLVGGPSCTHHSRARAGKPVNEQLRMSPWHVLEWLELLNVEAFIIENVPEIQSWGPVDDDNQPVRDGSVFDAWVNALNQLGYAVEWTELTAADYGDPTNRTRFFIVGQQRGSVTFPEPTHSDDDPELSDWRTAAEVIDWSDLGDSIFTRDLTNNRIHSPPKNTTMKRIAEGLRVHCGESLGAFADVLEKLGKPEIRALRESPVIPAEYAAEVADAVDEPFLVKLPAGGTCLSTTQLLRQQDGGPPWGDVTDHAVPTIASKGAHAVVTTQLLRQQDGDWCHAEDVRKSPVPTIATRGGHSLATTAARPLVMPRNGARGHPVHSNALYKPEGRPHHVVTAKNHDGYLVTPFIEDFQSGVKSVEAPLPTQPGKERFALCVPELWPWGLDVRYRMLQPRELKQAQGFPADYDIAGTKKDRTKQIGNAVPVNMAKALCKHVITEENPSLASFGGGIKADDDPDIPAYEEAVGDD